MKVNKYATQLRETSEGRDKLREIMETAHWTDVSREETREFIREETTGVPQMGREILSYCLPRAAGMGIAMSALNSLATMHFRNSPQLSLYDLLPIALPTAFGFVLPYSIHLFWKKYPRSYGLKRREAVRNQDRKYTLAELMKSTKK